MAELLVVAFKDNMHRACGLLDELRVLDDAWILEIRDAVAVHRDLKGALKMDQSYRPTGREGASSGSALGLLIGATLDIPFTAGASAPVAAGAIVAVALAGGAIGATAGALDASFWKDAFGIPEDFVTATAALVGPGDSAIYTILDAADPSIALAQFQGYGGAVLHSTLSSRQQADIEKAIDASL